MGGCIVVVVCIFLARGAALGGFERTEMGARAAAMGFAAVAQQGDAWSLLFNPALLGAAPPLSLSAFAAPAPYGLRELSLTGAAAVLPAWGGGAGLSARRYGFELYREVSLSAGSGTACGPILAGIACNLHSASIRGYGSASTIGIDAGLLVEPVEGLRWGFSATNLNAPRIGREGEELPRKFSTGIAFRPASGTSLEIDVVKEAAFAIAVRGGGEVIVREMLALRCGVTDGEFSGGIGVHAGPVAIDYAYLSHAALGGTHEVSVTITLR